MRLMSKQQRHCVRYRPALHSKTNHVKPLHSSAEWKRSKFPQADYLPRHNPDFKTVFGITYGPFSLIKINKTWGTNKQTKKMKISISTTRFGTTSHQLTSFASYTLWWSPSSFAKLEFSLQRVRKPLSSGQKWYPQVDYLQRHTPDFRFSFWAPEVPFLKWGKAVKVPFSYSQNRHYWCPKRKSETYSEIRPD